MMTMSLANKILTRSRTALSETASLASALVKAPATSTTKARDVFIRHARNHNNSVAASVLRADREVGLLRYHGIQGYAALWAQGNPSGLVGLVYGGTGGRGMEPWLRLRKLMFGSRNVEHDGGETTVSGEDSQDATNLPRRAAKVAFMITSSQRMELTARLGYGTDEIKKLKPLEALLILENDVKPGNDKTVMRLVRENEELQRAEAEEAIAEQKALEASVSLGARASSMENDSVRQLNTEKGTSADGVTEENRQNDRLLEISGGFDSPPPPKEGSEEQTDRSEKCYGSEPEGGPWFEVVETDEDSGISIVVALYRTEEEAQDCINWKMDVARRRHQEKKGCRPLSRFELRQR